MFGSLPRFRLPKKLRRRCRGLPHRFSPKVWRTNRSPPVRRGASTRAPLTVRGKKRWRELFPRAYAYWRETSKYHRLASSSLSSFGVGALAPKPPPPPLALTTRGRGAPGETSAASSTRSYADHGTSCFPRTRHLRRLV